MCTLKSCAVRPGARGAVARGEARGGRSRRAAAASRPTLHRWGRCVPQPRRAGRQQPDVAVAGVGVRRCAGARVARGRGGGAPSPRQLAAARALQGYPAAPRGPLYLTITHSRTRRAVLDSLPAQFDLRVWAALPDDAAPRVLLEQHVCLAQWVHTGWSSPSFGFVRPSNALLLGMADGLYCSPDQAEQLVCRRAQCPRTHHARHAPRSQTAAHTLTRILRWCSQLPLLSKTHGRAVQDRRDQYVETVR